MSLIEEYRNTSEYLRSYTSIKRWTIWDMMSNEEKLQYHLEEFRSKPEWQRLQDATLFIKSRIIKKIFVLWLKTGFGRKRLESRKIKFWKRNMEWNRGL